MGVLPRQGWVLTQSHHPAGRVHDNLQRTGDAAVVGAGVVQTGDKWGL